MVYFCSENYDDDDCDDENYYLSEENPFNISNDQYYKVVKKKFNKQEWCEKHNFPYYGSKTIAHSIPAYDLWRPFFPTIITERRLLNLHRPRLRPLPSQDYMPVKNLAKCIIDFQRKLRLRVIRDINKGLSEDEIVTKNLLIRRACDLTAKRGELILFEYMEQYPPILSQTGMASNIKTYTQPKNVLVTSNAKSKASAKINSLKRMRLEGETQSLIPSYQSNLGTDAFLGYQETLSNRMMKPIYFNRLKSGNSQQMIENNLYRAPIYEHVVPETDFIVIKTQNGFYIRSCKTIFTVGQIYPLVVIPPPTEQNINRFRSDLAIKYANNFMAECKTKVKKVRWDDISRLFPDISCSLFNKRMKRKGTKRVVINKHEYHDEKLNPCQWHQENSELGRIPLLKARSMMTPEQYCINMATLCGRQLLRNLNYREAEILSGQETEVKAAPWNTSKAIMETSIGRCYLDLAPHLIDPTGKYCKEGFSCIQLEKSFANEINSTTLTNGFKSKVNTSIQPNNKSFQRPNKDAILRENLKRLSIYQNQAQIISELQNKALASNEDLSTDEDDDDDEEYNYNRTLTSNNSKVVDIYRNEEHSVSDDLDCFNEIEKMVTQNKSLADIEAEKEEAARKELLRSLKLTNIDTIE